MDENKDVQQTEQQDKQPAPLSEARKTALLRYMAILFGVAFVIYFIINFILSCTVRYLQKRSKRNKQVTVELLTTE